MRAIFNVFALKQYVTTLNYQARVRAMGEAGRLIGEGERRKGILLKSIRKIWLKSMFIHSGNC